jgi:hypothetical protein
MLVGYNNKKRLDWSLELVVALFPRSDGCSESEDSPQRIDQNCATYLSFRDKLDKFPAL